MCVAAGERNSATGRFATSFTDLFAWAASCAKGIGVLRR
jgi:hypothetical protein